MRRQIQGMAGAAFTLLLAGAASADPVTARSTATWDNPTPDESSQIYAMDYLETMNTGAPLSWMQWGAPCIGVDCAVPSASGPSRLAYRGAEASGGYGALLPVGVFTFHNGDNYTNTQFAQVDFTLRFEIDTPGGTFDGVLPVVLVIVNTPNTPGAESDWPDYLDFLTAGPDPLALARPGSDGALYSIRFQGFAEIESLRVDEGETASAFVFAQVDREPGVIAAPGAAGLFGAASLLALLMRRRLSGAA